MLCERCNAQPATVHMKQIANNEMTELHLCQSCAAEMEIPISFDNIFQGFLDSFFTSTGGKSAATPKNEVCSQCGTTYQDFKNTGRLGCENCYMVFQNELSGIFKNVQGSFQHQGKFPKRAGVKLIAKREIDKLKLELARAIENEAFETAAALRDKIREMERGMNDVVQ